MGSVRAKHLPLLLLLSQEPSWTHPVGDGADGGGGSAADTLVLGLVRWGCHTEQALSELLSESSMY